MEPSLEEMKEMEAKEPGAIRRVEDFVVGRKGYGYVRFLGETDVSGLDITDIVQFDKLAIQASDQGETKHSLITTLTSLKQCRVMGYMSLLLSPQSMPVWSCD